MEPEAFPKYEGKGAVLPVALFETMARKYFGGVTSDGDWRNNAVVMGLPEPVIAISDGLFGKLCKSHYGDGLTLPQERGPHAPESTEDTGGDETTGAKVEFADLPPLPHMVPKGLAARKAKEVADGIHAETAEGT